MKDRLAYYSRIFGAYTGSRQSALSFWHERPAIELKAFESESDFYYMTFRDKANYQGPFDENGVPMLDYRGDIGIRYNPIAVAQYGLACFNMFRETGDESFKDKFINMADWLTANLEVNGKGLHVWTHHFDWPYFKLLKAPWYSGLAQGQGISMLARAYKETGDSKYLVSADKAFVALITDTADGGTRYIDDNGYWWIEEYITEPPTHILNGFIWALWGVRDYIRFCDGEKSAAELWEQSTRTLKENLGKFDAGYWSLYDLAPLRLRNPASSFYHRLHIVQMEVMYRLTGAEAYRSIQSEWHGNQCCILCRTRAFWSKVLFKLVNY